MADRNDNKPDFDYMKYITKTRIALKKELLENLKGGKFREEKKSGRYQEYARELDTLYAALRSMKGKAFDEKMHIPLIMHREGVKRTSINIVEISLSLNREPEHIGNFISEDLDVSGTIVDTDLILKGSVKKPEVEKSIKRYMAKYVMCENCREYQTILAKKQRLHRIECLKCHSRKVVTEN